MNKLSISDRKFLAACKISTTVEPFTDETFLRACGISCEPTHDEIIMGLAQRIAQHTAPGIPEDDTVLWLRRAGVPVTAENWMQLQFMGNPPAIGEIDGEILADLPDFVRKVYDPDFEPDDEED